MSPLIKIKIPRPSTVLMIAVMLTVVALPGFGSIRGLLFIGLGLYLMFLVFINRGPIRWVHATWVIAFFLLTQLSIQWSIYPSGAKLVINNTTFALLLNWSFAEYVYQGKRDMGHICKIMAVMSFFLGINFVMNGTASQDGRLSVGVNENVLGMSAAYLYGVLLYGVKKANWRNWKLNILTIAVAAIAVLTGSRKALVMLMIFTTAYILLWKPEKDMRRFAVKALGILAVCVIAIILLMEVDVLYNTIGNRLETLYRQWFKGEAADASAVTRERMIEIGQQLIKRRPWFGYGHNGFKLASGYFTYSHNNYIELMCSVGIVGMVMYYAPLAFFAIKSFLLWCRGIEGAIFPLTVLCMLFLNDVGQVSYYSLNVSIFLGIAIGYVYLLEEQNQPQRARLSANGAATEADETPEESPTPGVRRRRSVGRVTFAPGFIPASARTESPSGRQQQTAPTAEKPAQRPTGKPAQQRTATARKPAQQRVAPAAERPTRKPTQQRTAPAAERPTRKPTRQRTAPTAEKPVRKPTQPRAPKKTEK